MQKHILIFLILLLVLSGCAPQNPDSALPSEEPASPRWKPPDRLPVDLSEEAASALNALDLCKAFAAEMNEHYPGYAPTLSEEDISYFERRLSDPSADLASLSAELAQTIVSLRQQVYLRMEETSKRFMPLPDGLEEFVRAFEDRFREIGW